VSVNRNLEKSSIYINKFSTGMWNNRSPLFTELSSLGVQVISRYDTLWDGLNMDISHQMTLVRRYGFLRYCSTAFGSDEVPLNFFSFKNTTGVIKAMVDTTSNVSYFTSSSITSLYSKGTPAQTSFTKVGDTLYMSDGTNAKKWDGTTVSGWGIVAPVTAPILGISSGNGMTVPVPGTFTTATTGGTLAPGTYYYRIAATNGLGTTGASEETGITVPTGTSTNTVTVTWEEVEGATGYTVYGRTLGGELLMATISGGSTVSWVDDGSVTPSGALPSGLLTTANGGYQYVYVYKNSSTGHISSASPYSASTGNLSDQTVTIEGSSSTDPQVDKVDIYRTLDGGANYYYLATIDNGGTWSYTDSSPDSALNNFLIAPLAGVNDPPPAGISVSCFWMGCVWVAAGHFLYFGGGASITNGVPEECFPASNVFTLPGTIVAMAATSQGLVVWTPDDAFVVTGTTTGNFVCQLWQSNLGVYGQNSVCQDGDLFYLFTMQGQLFQFSSSLTEIGFPVQKNIAAMNPANVYMTLHRSGVDEGLFISDGSTNMYRYSIAMQCWSTVAQPVGGVNCLKSIEVSTATYKLMMGRATGAGYILARDTNTFADDGSAYPADVTIGSLILAPPRQTAPVASVLLQSMPVGTYPTVSVLPNEISGTFINIGVTPTGLPNRIPDPWELPASTSVLSYRHDLASAQQPIPNRIQHMQVRLSFATEIAYNEILTLAVA